ncbi:MerR family DNA-binding transcriptional regulator, partial [Planktotalea sp.]|uniref:MerR family DNA-binding transcriptional regulator n=1 Tax=Planktotalea sp. TaxID=2029877 RepID=UPI003299E79C
MLKIGELAKRTGVSTDTLRLYERRGLIQSERMANGYRVYQHDFERVVHLIRQGQRLGFTLREMA